LYRISIENSIVFNEVAAVTPTITIMAAILHSLTRAFARSARNFENTEPLLRDRLSKWKWNIELRRYRIRYFTKM